jgi:hypothetical protein
VNDATLTFDNIKFTNMETYVSGAFGPGFGKTGWAITFTDCVFDNTKFTRNSNNLNQAGLFSLQQAHSFTGTLTRCLFINPSTAATSQEPGIILASRETNDYSFILNSCTLYTKETGSTALGALFKNAQFLGTTDSRVIKNCIFSSAGDAVAYDDGSSGVDSDVTSYTCFHNITSPTAGTGNITSDPLFVDPDGSNFNLRPSSPCIDTGVII